MLQALTASDPYDDCSRIGSSISKWHPHTRPRWPPTMDQQPLRDPQHALQKLAELQKQLAELNALSNQWPSCQPARSAVSCAEISESSAAESVTQSISKRSIAAAPSSCEPHWSLEPPSTKGEGYWKADHEAVTTTKGEHLAAWQQADARPTWRENRNASAGPPAENPGTLSLGHGESAGGGRQQPCGCESSSSMGEGTWHIFRWAHNPWVWNETTNEYFYINNPPAEWKCHFFHRKRQKINYWTNGKRWFLEPISPKWSFILRAGLDIGESGWLLSYNGSWMMNKTTSEFFLTKNGFSQSITVANGPSQWKLSTCSDQKGNSVRYWYSENRWFLEPQPADEKWTPPPEGELLWLDPAEYQIKLAWGNSEEDYKTILRTNETKEWQAFNSTDGKGTWWWHEQTEEWFLEAQSGTWTQLMDKSNQPHWCHPDGRCFHASVEPWLIENDTNLSSFSEGEITEL